MPKSTYLSYKSSKKQWKLQRQQQRKRHYDYYMDDTKCDIHEIDKNILLNLELRIMRFELNNVFYNMYHDVYTSSTIVDDEYVFPDDEHIKLIIHKHLYKAMQIKNEIEFLQNELFMITKNNIIIEFPPKFL